MAAPVDAFVGTDRQGQLLKQAVAAIGVGLLARAAERKAVAQLGAHAGTTQHSEGCASNKLWGQGPRPVGKPEAIQDHPSHGLAGCEDVLGLGHETGSDHTNEASVFDHRSEHAYVIQAFDADRFHVALLH